MSRFFVGQRVRVRLDDESEGPDFTGKEGYVAGTLLPHEVNPGDEAKECYDVVLDGVSDSLEYYFYDWQLEPITDCYDLTTWDTCVWQPEHLRVTV